MERISFKFCTLVYMAIHGLAPRYPNLMCTPVPNLSALRSAARGDLVVPRTKLQLGNRVAQDTSVLSFPLHRLTVSRVRAANFVRRPCSDSGHVTAPYKLSFYYYYYYYSVSASSLNLLRTINENSAAIKVESGIIELINCHYNVQSFSRSV